VRDAADRAFIESELAGRTVVGYVAFSNEIRTAVRDGCAPYDVSPQIRDDVAKIWDEVVGRVGS